MIRIPFPTAIVAVILSIFTTAGGRACVAGPVDLDDSALPLPRGEVRSEAEQDRMAAVSLFAAGRMLEQRQDLPGALRRYERAFRLDPTAEPVLREIIPLAFSLSREEEAVRYATKLAELDATDPVLMRRLGVVLTEQGEHKQALKLYEKVRELEAQSPKSSAHIMLQLEMGRLYVLTEQYEKAAALFSTVSKALDAPNDHGLSAVLLKTIAGDKGEVHELMAAAFLEAGQTDEAAKSFARLEKFSANKPVAAYNQARVAAKLGRHDEALAKLQEYFDARESSRGVAPYELLGKVLGEAKREGELLGRLERMQAEQQGNVPLNFALAEEYFKKNEFERAEPRYRVVLASQPAGQVYRRLVEVYRHTGQEEKLVQILGEIAGKGGSLEIVAKELESIIKDEELTKSVVELAREKLAEAKPENHDPLQAAGLLALEAKSYDAAGELFERAIQAKPADKVEVLLVWGLQLFLDEKFSEAAAVFKRAVDEKALPESNPAFYFYLAGALAMEGKTDEALAAAQTAAEKKPDDPRFESRVAWIYYHAKRYDEATERYRDLVRKYDTNFDAPEIRTVLHDTRLILSNIAVLQDKLPEADEWVEQVLDEFPDDVGALNDLGYLWADQNKRLARSHRMIRHAVEAEPENAAYRDSLGWVLFRLGKFDEALVEQKKAVELSQVKEKESDGVMYDHLGDIHAALGQKDQAADAWQKAAKAFDKAGEKVKLEAVRKKIEDR